MSSQWLRFLAIHCQELGPWHTIPAWMRDEYQLLPPGQICSCHKPWERDQG